MIYYKNINATSCSILSCTPKLVFICLNTFPVAQTYYNIAWMQGIRRTHFDRILNLPSAVGECVYL